MNSTSEIRKPSADAENAVPLFPVAGVRIVKLLTVAAAFNWIVPDVQLPALVEISMIVLVRPIPCTVIALSIASALP